MSSGTATPIPLAAEPELQPGADRHEAFIQNRLRQTQRQVKGVDIAIGLMVLAIGVLAYLLAAALIDHWLIAGGLGFWGRLLLLLGLLGGGGYYLARRVLPPLLQRINPIFAAHTIERSRPTLKNSLINFLLLRGHRREMPGVVYQALEQRAASDLSKVPIETTVDRAPVIRLGYLLAATLAVCALYLVLSPKSPLTSAARVFWPWAGIQAPTRVTIKAVEPGDAVAFHGEQIVVSAEIRGAAEDEPVMLVYDTADGQSVEQIVPMTLPRDGYRYRCTLPPGNLGLQQDYRYYLTAGDCRTPVYAVDVRTAPAIWVDRVEYHYPEYTGMDDRIVPRQGDLRALERTRVTIHATANRAIKRAEIDLDCDGRRGLKMQTDQDRATGEVVLRLNADDPTLPEHDCYQIRFTDRDRRWNRRPIRHNIEVIRDLPPEVQIIEPRKDEVRLAEDGKLLIRVRAEDPDFALSRVLLRAERDGRSLPTRPLLAQPYQGEFTGAYVFEPARLGLKAGDRVLYWAEAEDNKQPKPGHADTAQRQIVIVGPQFRDPPQRPDDTPGQPAQRGREKPQGPSGEQPSELPGNQQGALPEQPQDLTQEPEPGKPPRHQEEQQQDKPRQPAEHPEEGETQSSGTQQQPSAESSQQPNEPIDPDTQEGDAMEEILEHRQEQANKQGEKSSDTQSGSETASQPQGDSGSQTGARAQEESTDRPGSQTGNKAGEKSGKKSGAELGIQAGGQSGNQSGSKPNSASNTQTGSEQDGQSGSESGEKPSDQSGSKAGSQDGGQTSGKKAPQTETQPGGEAGTDTGKGADTEKGSGSGSDSRSETPSESQSGTSSGNQPGSESESGHQGAPQQPGTRQSDGQTQPSESGSSPAAQEANQTRRQPSRSPSQGHPQPQQDSPQSPSISPKQSESEGETAGDRSGGGEQGGGQQSPQAGRGTAGSHTEGEQGSLHSDRQGEGETGTRAGRQVETDRQTGSSATRPEGDGTGRQRRHPGGADAGGRLGQQGDSATPGTPQKDPADGGRPGSRTSDGPTARGSGNPATGGHRPQPQSDGPSGSAEEPGGDDPNIEYARKATDLALEHLRDHMNQDDSDLLSRLGWTPEEAQRFLARWQQLKRAAGQPGSNGDDARQSLDEALRSLGLRRGSTELRGGVQADQLHKRESTRFDAPGQWDQWLKAYTRGVAGGGQ